MPRVRPVTMDGLTLNISPLTFDEFDEYLKENRRMLDQDPKPTDEEWSKRTLVTIIRSLNRAAGRDEWDLEGAEGKKKLTSELDIPFINKLHEEFLEISGLKVPKDGKAGESQATPTSR
jgi:hypothetical protein